MPIITFSGGLASGAREIARCVAEDLGLDYVDRELLIEAARELGVSVAMVESRDERPSSIGERLASVMRTLMERSAAAGTPDPIGGGLEMVLTRTYGEAAELPSGAPQGQLDDESYIATLTSLIKGIAVRGDAVILGRGSQAILQHTPESLHVLIVSQMELRIDSLVAREDISREEAERRIRESDHNRHAFHQRYFKVDVDDPMLYDLMIHSGRMAPDLAVRLITLAVRDRTPRPG